MARLLVLVDRVSDCDGVIALGSSPSICEQRWATIFDGLIEDRGTVSHTVSKCMHTVMDNRSRDASFGSGCLS